MTKLNDGVTLTFAYNGDGARFSKDDGSTTAKFVYDRRTDTPGLDPVLIETDSGGTTTARYTNRSAAETPTSRGEGGLIAQKRSSTTSYYHFEAIGTTRQLTNSTESVSDSYTMDAWGNALASSRSTVNAFRYVGKANYNTDGQSGLMLLGVRYHDAAVGRFLTPDPLGMGGGDLNFYRLVNDAPVTSIDPSGRVAIQFEFNAFIHKRFGEWLKEPGLNLLGWEHENPDYRDFGGGSARLRSFASSVEFTRIGRIPSEEVRVDHTVGSSRRRRWVALEEFGCYIYESGTGTLSKKAKSVSNSKCKTVVQLQASAGYPLAEPFSPNIDYNVNFHFKAIGRNKVQMWVEVSHDEFPNFEALVDLVKGWNIYAYDTTAGGPTIGSLNRTVKFTSKKTVVNLPTPPDCCAAN